MIRWFVVLAFFVSGASSLMLEVVWSKALGHVLGNTLEAITTVVSAYMGGLALGASIAGRMPSLARRPVLAYGLLEIGIGLFGLASLGLIAALEGPLGAAYSQFGSTSVAYGTIRFLATFALLLVPTTLMGATLPVLVAWGTERADLGRVLGTLYAVNTAGAVAGTLLGGFVFLPALGLTRTALVAGFLSITLGVVMALVSRSVKAPAKPATTTTTATTAAAAGPAGARPRGAEKATSTRAFGAAATPIYRPQLVLAMFALSGAVALSTQIAWSRLGAILLGSSVYSFTLVLATFLVGIAAGSALVVPVLARRGPSWRLFAALQWLAAAGILYCSIRIVDAPWSLLSDVVAARGRVGWLWVRESLLLAGFMLPACLAFGATFPVATRLSAFEGDTPARTTGRAYGWNTLGTITGSLLTGFLLVRLIGMRGTLIGVGALALLLGCVAWWLAPAPVRGKSSIPEGAPIARLAVPALAVALFVVAAFFAPPWNRGVLAMGAFRPLVATMTEQAMTPSSARAAMRDQLGKEELVSFEEGRQATVTVHRTKSTPPIFSLRVNGKTDASTSIDMYTQILSGQIPMFWAPDSARVLVVGFGSGVTVGATLTHPLKSLDLVEIEPAVLGANKWFAPYNGDPLDDPRIRVHVEDGRAFIAHASERYDVIISEPSNPWLAGVNNLFTADFYRLVKQRLAPGGVFCQWMQFYEMSGTTLASLMRSIHSVFPQGHVFLSNRDILLVLPADGAPVDYRRIQVRMQRPEVAKDLARLGAKTPADVLAYHQGSLAQVVARLPEAPLNTDDRPIVEYRAPKDFYTVLPSVLPFSEQTMWDQDPLRDVSTWVTGIPTDEVALEIGRSLLARGNLSAASRWFDGLVARDPNQGGKLLAEVEEAAKKRDIDQKLAQVGRILEQNGDLTVAQGLVQQVLSSRPAYPKALIERGRIAMRQDSLANARTYLLSSLVHAGGDDQYQAYCNLGVIAMREGNHDLGLDYFSQAIQVRPEEAGGYLYRAKALAQLGRRNEALLLLTQGENKVIDKEALRAAYNEMSASGASL